MTVFTFKDLNPDTPQALFTASPGSKWQLFIRCPYTTLPERKQGAIIFATAFDAPTAKFYYTEIGVTGLTSVEDQDGNLDITVDGYTPSFKLIMDKDTGAITVETIDDVATGKTVMKVSRIS